MLTTIDRLDQASLLGMQRRRRRSFTILFQALTYSGNSSVWILSALTFWILLTQQIAVIPQQRTVLQAMLCALIAWVLGRGIKSAVGRRRPVDQLSASVAAIPTPQCKSFPSTHAAAAFAFACALILVGHPWAGGVLIWAILVSFSRFYLGVHYPSDLVGGMILGLLCGFWIFLLTT